jgi:hypothetical protein
LPREPRRSSHWSRRPTGSSALIGRRIFSFGLLLVSAGLAIGLYALVCAQGTLRSWNGSTASGKDWGRVVYSGWWANFHERPWCGVIVMALGTYMVYFLNKQILMGAVFAFFAGSALRKNFGVAPNLRLNTDGYWGLRPLRQFMQWTYIFTMSHFLLTIGFFAVWLPFTEWTVLVILLVMLVNLIVVLYPSSVAMRAAIEAKKTFVAQFADKQSLDAAEQELVQRTWSLPNLPFNLRSAFSAATLYVLVPIVLALVSGLIKD